MKFPDFCAADELKTLLKILRGHVAMTTSLIR